MAVSSTLLRYRRWASGQPGFPQHLLEVGKPHRGILLRVGLFRVLLGLDNDPAGIAAKLAEDRSEIDHAVAGDRVDPLHDAIEETPVACLGLRAHIGPHVLGVDMADAALVAPGERGWVGAAPGRMPRVQDEM